MTVPVRMYRELLSSNLPSAVVGEALPATGRLDVMASRIAMLEFELTIARSLIADLSRRPTLEDFRALMASAAARPVAMADAVPSSHRACRHCASMFLAEVVTMHEDMCEMRGEVDL